MRHFFTLLLLAGPSLCFGQITRESKPALPLVASVAAAQSPYVRSASVRPESSVYICDSKTANSYHKQEDCPGLDQCPHEVVEVTSKQAEQDYGRVKCKVCY